MLPQLDLFPVKKLFCKFDISGDTKEEILTNKHPVIGGASNFFELISYDFDVPLDLKYSPVLTIFVYDNLMGFLGKRLVGVTNIPLEPYCKKILDKINKVSNVLFGKKANNTAKPEEVKLLFKRDSEKNGPSNVVPKFKGLLLDDDKALEFKSSSPSMRE